MSKIKKTDIEKTASTLADLIESGVKTEIGKLILNKLRKTSKVSLVAPQLIDLVASRYMTANKVIEDFLKQGYCPNIIELGAGFSPHSTEFSSRIKIYIEVDFPTNSKIKQKIIKEINPSDKTIYFGQDAFCENVWKEISKKINFDQPTIIFGEGFFQYTTKEQRESLSKQITPLIKQNGCLFFEDSFRYHPELDLDKETKTGVKEVITKSKSLNYKEKISQKELTKEWESYGFNVKRISPIFLKMNKNYQNFKTWVLTTKGND